MELMVMPPVFFLRNVMLGGLRFSRMPTYRAEPKQSKGGESAASPCGRDVGRLR